MRGARKHVSTIYSCQVSPISLILILSSQTKFCWKNALFIPLNSINLQHTGNNSQRKQEIAYYKDPKLGNEIESHNPRTLTRTRSSRRLSRDLDNNPWFNQTPLERMMKSTSKTWNRYRYLSRELRSGLPISIIPKKWRRRRANLLSIVTKTRRVRHITN